MFSIYRGRWEYKYFRKTASTAFAANTLVAEGSGDDIIEPADSSDTAVVGIILQTIASTDSDYADNTRVLVAVPLDASSEMLADTSSTIAVTDEGELMDLTDEKTVNQAASSADIVKLKQFVSATTGVFTVNKKAFV